MSTIAIDIDSTLYDFDTLAREAALHLWQETGDEDYRRGIYYSSEDWRAPAELIGLNKWLKVIARCHDDEMILKQQPFSGAVETCHALEEAGHKLIFISNRKTETERATHEWLDINGFMGDYDSPRALIVTEGDKKPLIARCQYLIDDRLKTCVEFVYDFDWKNKYGSNNIEMKRRAFVLKYPYNQNATDIPGLYLAPTWAGLNVYMQRKGVLPELAVKALA